MGLLGALTKKAALDKLDEEMEKIQIVAEARGYYRFNPDIGWDQIDGGGEEVNRLYGSWATLYYLYYQLYEA